MIFTSQRKVENEETGLNMEVFITLLDILVLEKVRVIEENQNWWGKGYRQRPNEIEKNMVVRKTTKWMITWMKQWLISDYYYMCHHYSIMY